MIGTVRPAFCNRVREDLGYIKKADFRIGSFHSYIGCCRLFQLRVVGANGWVPNEWSDRVMASVNYTMTSMVTAPGDGFSTTVGISFVYDLTETVKNENHPKDNPLQPVA